MADQNIILSRIPGRVTLIDGGANTSAQINGAMLDTPPSGGSGVWASTETQDLFAASGSAGIEGSWLSTEAQDNFTAAGALPIAGIWASTEATDTFYGFVFVPPNFVWASTEAQDKWRTTSGFERLEIVDKLSAGSSSFNYTTTGRDRILVLLYSSGYSGDDAAPSYIDTITVTDHPEIEFTPQVTSTVGPNDDSQMFAVQILWAYAPDVISNKTIHVSAVGPSTTGNVSIFAIKGLNGNYSNPFADPNPRCRGGMMGSLFPDNGIENVGSDLPLETGVLSSPSLSSINFSSANMATLSNGDLTVNSDGTNSPIHSNYAKCSAGVAQTENVYYEITFDEIHGTDYATGLLWEGGDPTDLCTNGANGIIIRGNGDIYTGGILQGTIAAPANGDVIGIALNPSNAVCFIANLTQGEFIYDSAKYASFGPGASRGFFITGSYGAISSTDSGVQRRGYTVGGGRKLTPIAFPGGTNVNSQQTYNFGATPFFGSVPSGFSGGWAFLVDDAPARIHYPSVVVGLSATIHSTGTYMPDPPGGFEEVTSQQTFGAQVTIDMLGYAKVCTENFLESDNELQTDGALPHWQMIYDTLVVGNANPGDWDSTEATDTFHGVGYQGAFGVVGDLHSTEVKDTFAATGYLSSSGPWASTEVTDIFSAYGFQPLTGVWTSTEATDHFAGTGIGLGEDGTWISVEAIDIFAATGTVPIIGQFDTFEAPDRFLALGAGVTRVRRRRSFFVT